MTPNGPPDLRCKRRIDWTLFATVMQMGTRVARIGLAVGGRFLTPENRAREFDEFAIIRLRDVLGGLIHEYERAAV